MSEQPHRHHTRFIGRLKKLKSEDDRAALATLRRGLVDFGRDFSIYSVIGNAIPEDAGNYAIDKYLLTACLFAFHQLDTDTRVSLGQAARNLRAQLKVGQESLDKRFSAILNSEEEDLPIRLRQIISLLGSREISLSYDQLLSDLLRWRSDDRGVQKRWAKDYWTGRDEPDISDNDKEQSLDQALTD